MKKLLGIGLPLILFLSVFGVIFYILPYQNEDVVRLYSVQAIVVFMAAVWLAIKFWKNEKLQAKSLLDIAILIFMGTCLLSIIKAKNPYQGFSELFNTCIYATLYFLISRNIKDEEQVNNFLSAVLIISVIVAVHAAFQYMGFDFLWFMFPSGASFSRAASVFGNADFLGGYLAIVFPVAFSLFLYRKKKLLFGISCAIIFFSLLLTYTRSAWISWGLSLIFLIVILGVVRKDVISKNVKWLLGGICALILMAVTLNFIKGNAIFSRLSTIFSVHDYNAQVRFGLWNTALQIFKTSPVIGVGFDNFKIIAQGCRIHNEYLQLLAETGVIGLTAFAFFIYAYFSAVFKNIKNISPYRQVLCMGMTAGVLAMLIDSIFCFPLHRVSHNVLFWSFLGMSVAMGRIEEKTVSSVKCQVSSKSEKTKDKKEKKWGKAGSIGIITLGVVLIVLIVRTFLGVFYYQKGFEINKILGSRPEMRDNVIKVFEKASRFAKYEYQIQHDWAIVAIQSGDAEKGRKAMLWSERLYPDKMADLRLELGMLYYQKGDYANAENTWKEAVEKFPFSSLGHFYLCSLYNNQHKLELAIKHCSTALEIEPANPDYYRALAKIYFQKKDYSSARQAAVKGLAIAPGDAEFQNMMKALK